MSDSSSSVSGDYDATSEEPAVRLAVRKDLFPDDRPSKVMSKHNRTSAQEELDGATCVKLETDFEQSIDDINNQKLQMVNGSVSPPKKPRHRKHKQHSRHKSERVSKHNGCLSLETKKKKSSRESRSHRTLSQVKGGKNLNLVSSSEYQNEEESSEDEMLGCSVKLPVKVVRQSGKPYSHELSQLSSKKSKIKDISGEKRSHVVMPSSGKPRSMLGICASKSKKKSKKPECTPTYSSQIVEAGTIKIKIRRTSSHEAVSI